MYSFLFLLPILVCCERVQDVTSNYAVDYGSTSVLAFVRDSNNHQQQQHLRNFRHQHLLTNTVQQWKFQHIQRKATNAFLSLSLDDVTPQIYVPNLFWCARLLLSGLGGYVAIALYLDQPRGILNVIDGVDIECKPSNVVGAGLGLFSKTDLKRGTVLGTYPGVVIPLQQNVNKLQQYPECEAYIWRFSDNKFVIDPTNSTGSINSVCYGGNPSVWGSTFLLENFFRLWNVPTTLCRINEPPLGKDVNVVTSEDLNNRCVSFELERDVYAGEEFYIDYGLSYDRSMYGRFKL